MKAVRGDWGGGEGRCITHWFTASLLLGVQPTQGFVKVVRVYSAHDEVAVERVLALQV